MVTVFAYGPLLDYGTESGLAIRVREIVNLEVDQMLIVDFGANEEAAGEAATTLGPSLPEQESGVVMI